MASGLEVYWTPHAIERLHERAGSASLNDQHHLGMMLRRKFVRDEVVPVRDGGFLATASLPDGPEIHAVLKWSYDKELIVVVTVLPQGDPLISKVGAVFISPRADTQRPFADLALKPASTSTEPSPEPRETIVSQRTRPILPNTQPELGQAIRQWRADNGLSMEAFNDRAGKPYTRGENLSPVETGKYMPSEHRAAMIAKVMGYAMPDDWPVSSAFGSGRPPSSKSKEEKDLLPPPQVSRRVSAPAPAPRPSSGDPVDDVLQIIGVLLRSREDSPIVAYLLLKELRKQPADPRIVADLITGSYRLKVEHTE